jgi:hypothetical protein
MIWRSNTHQEHKDTEEKKKVPLGWRFGFLGLGRARVWTQFSLGGKSLRVHACNHVHVFLSSSSSDTSHTSRGSCFFQYNGSIETMHWASFGAFSPSVVYIHVILIVLCVIFHKKASRHTERTDAEAATGGHELDWIKCRSIVQHHTQSPHSTLFKTTRYIIGWISSNLLLSGGGIGAHGNVPT